MYPALSCWAILFIFVETDLYMKRVLAVLLLLILGFAGYIWFTYFKGGKKKPRGPEPVPLQVSKHSDAFNISVQQALTAYYGIAEGLVNWDASAVKSQGELLKLALDSLQIEELKQDTTGIYESVLDPLHLSQDALQGLLQSSNLEQARHAFNSLSENLRLLFIIVKYDREKIYWNECPMAFGEDRPAYWLSKAEAIRNPYLGLQHPEYKDKMLDCGTNKETIDFTVPDTTANRPAP